MPVILAKELEKIWLDPEATEKELLDCLQSYPAEKMVMYQVSKKVNSTKNSTPDMVDRYKPKVKKNIDNYFQS